MKYELERLGPYNFEHLIQSLVRGIAGNSVTIYGSGPDGQREATIEDANLVICGGTVALGRTVVQAKFKDPNTKQENWDWLRKNLKDELDGFKKKLTTHPHMVPETFLFFTNIVLTPVLDSGIRDRAEEFVAKYKDIIPHIFILGADDIRTMLENNRDVARCYASFIMPGDVLVELHENLKAIHNEKFEDLIEYARQMFREDSAVRLEQAGSVSSKSINIRNVYTDLEAKVRSGLGNEIPKVAAHIIDLGNRVQKRKRTGIDVHGGSFSKPQGCVPECNVVLIGNAGQGKSTLCQYICQIYRAALLRRFKPGEPETQSYFTGDSAPSFSVPRCERFPVLISLKRYAAWINKQDAENSRSVISYILSLINRKANASLSIRDFRRLLSGYSWAFLFDGLDEVPASSNRNEVLHQIQEFLERDLVESSCDSLVVCTSRPQGYDDAFSPYWYNHYELKDMSAPLCKSYIEKLLTFLEDNGDERDRYRKILHNALNDPMVSKLMTTPLYTAIIVLLVKMGGTPPTKRYALFQEYCEIVIKREKQKEMLPSLYDEYDWIMKLHAQIGFQLQAESETAENAAAELSAVRCKQLIVQFLQDEGFEGESLAKSEDFYFAMTTRLSFLSEVSGSDQEACVLFPLRSIQEYFAAEWLISFDNEDKLSEALEHISVSAYWRNVYLFVAGYFTKHRSRKNMNETLFRICQRNNGDENHESANAAAYRIAMPGSRLALDLLCDNLFNHPADQHRYLNIVSKLLDEDYSASCLNASLITQRLPPKIADIFLEEKVIPHIQKAKSAEGIAFEILWIMANNQNAKAYTQLEDLINDVAVPKSNTISRLLSDGFEKVGEKALHVLYRWITEEHFVVFCSSYSRHDRYWGFLSFFFAHSSGTEFSLTVLRQAVYGMLLADPFERNNFRVPYPNRLLKRIEADKDLHKRFFSEHVGNLGLKCRSIQQDRTKLSLSEYVEDFRFFQLNELAALAEFLHSPSYLGVRKLFEAYRDLPECCKDAFIQLIGQCNWFLHELADKLFTSENEEELFAHYDRTYVEACFKKDQEMINLVEASDLVSITRLNYWNEVRLSYGKTIPQDLIQAVLSTANEETIDDGFISFLYAATQTEETLSPELARFSMRYFPLLFQQSTYGPELALKVFAQTPLSVWVASNVEYPKTFPGLWFFYTDEEFASSLLEKIDHLAELGKEFLQVYALLPAVFKNLKSNKLSKVTPDTMMQYYHAINATGNQTALLGCIFRILAGPFSDEQKHTIWEKLVELLKICPLVFIWYILNGSFSMDGKMLIYEAITTLVPDTERNRDLLRQLASAILNDLESSPVDQNELIKLSRIAHSDRHFI